MQSAAASWLTGAEAAGLDAVMNDLSPDDLASRLAAAGEGEIAPMPDFSGLESDGSLWWTDGSPYVPGGERRCAGLPDGMTFAGMLDASRAGQTGGA
jgi:hypothetical protein